MASVVGPHTIEMQSGTYVDLLDPAPADVRLLDIAHNLAHICRYGGSTERFYSVAEHAVLVADRLEDQCASPATVLAGLHHDDAEAYLGDVPRPLKPLLGDAYRDLTDRLDASINYALELPDVRAVDQAAVKEADDWALAVEAMQLMPSRGEGWEIVERQKLLGGTGWGLIRCWRPREARRRYLAAHDRLVEGTA